MAEDFEVLDDRFRALLRPDSRVERLYTGTVWAEGPVYFREDGGHLLWSDIPNNRMLRWSERDGSVGVFRRPANFTNGHTRDRQGRLISCEHGGRCVSRTAPDGTYEVLVDHFHGRRLNSPNDVVVKSDGTIWFTDPPYGIIIPIEGYPGEMEYRGCHVFRFDPMIGELSVVADDFPRPNGLCFSPDESVLYVSDTSAGLEPGGSHHIRAFDVADGRRLTSGRVFAEIGPGMPDGFRIDVHGNVFTSALDGIHVYTPHGELLGKVRIPEKVANCTFGGPAKDRLFITASTSLYAVRLNTRGVQTPCSAWPGLPPSAAPRSRRTTGSRPRCAACVTRRSFPARAEAPKASTISPASPWSAP